MLSKRWIINYLLITLIIIFSWIGNKYPINEDQKIDQKTITSIKPQDVELLKIETADEMIQLQKVAGNWKITKPIEWLANNISVQRLVTLANLQPGSKLPIEEIDLSTLGLSLPRAVVTLNQQPVYFGGSNQIGNRRYLQVDSYVYLADDIHYPFIGLGLPGLVDNRLLPASLNLRSLQFNDFLVRKNQQTWVSDEASHSAEKTSQLISNWQTEPASKIQVYDTALSPMQKITATLVTGEVIDYYLLSIQPEIIIARPDLKLQYHFQDHLYYGLLSMDTR